MRGSAVLRMIDRAVGVPALWCLGRLSSRRVLPARIGRIGILETAAIGDTTLLSAVLYDLRAAFPAAQIVLFAGPSNAGIARLLEVPDQVVRLPVTRPLAAARVLSRYVFDVFLDFGPWPRINALLASSARSHFKVGFETPHQHRHYAYDQSVPHSSRRHELENFRSLVGAIGVPTGHPPGFASSVGRRERLPGSLQGTAYVVLHPWPGGYRSHLKEWPVEKWLELGEALSARGFRIALTGAPADRARNEAMIARRKPDAGPAWIDCATPDLEQTIAILRRSELTVSVNTGVMHLAAAVGTPVIGLHGPTSALRWRPVGPWSVAVTAPGKGCGYLHLGFEYPAQCDCMERIEVPQVLRECQALLASTALAASRPSAGMSLPQPRHRTDEAPRPLQSA